jgi:hypothetical protein
LFTAITPAAGAKAVENIDIHGFVSQGYMISDENNYLAETEDGTFEFNEMALNFFTGVSPDLNLGMQFFARDLGTLGNDEVTIDWAFASYRWKDWMGLRVGQVKIPQCLYGETRDMDMLRTNIFLPQSVYNEGWRDTFKALKGAAVFGEKKMNLAGELSYQLLYGIVNPDPEDGQSKFLNNRINSKINDYETDYGYALDLKWATPVPGLRIGGNSIGLKYDAFAVTENGFLWKAFSVQQYLMATNPALLTNIQNGPPDIALIDSVYGLASRAGYDFVGRNSVMSADVYTWSVSIEQTFQNLILAAEYTRTFSKLAVIIQDTGTVALPETELQMEGYYGSASYRFAPWLEGGVYYSEYYPDRDDRDGKKMSYYSNEPLSNAWQKDWALSFRFDINDNWVVKTEGHYIDGTAVMYAEDQEDPTDIERYWCLFAAKLTYSF